MRFTDAVMIVELTMNANISQVVLMIVDVKKHRYNRLIKWVFLLKEIPIKKHEIFYYYNMFLLFCSENINGQNLILSLLQKM